MRFYRYLIINKQLHDNNEINYDVCFLSIPVSTTPLLLNDIDIDIARDIDIDICYLFH